MTTFLKDGEQAKRMWTLRVKIDSWSKGKVDEVIRQRNRELLMDAYLRLPPGRVWLFVKFSRFEMLNGKWGLEHNEEGVAMAEDAIARGTSSPVCHLYYFTMGSLTRNMQRANWFARTVWPN
jgi:hypothetical protein